jgi:hypothetical protein
MSAHIKLRSLLLEAGLSETEAILYTEILKKPAKTIWELVQRTGLSKSAVYRAFESLENTKLAKKTPEGIKAQSLKSLVAELKTSSRRLNKTAYKIKSLSPFLRTPSESIEYFETFYTPEQIEESYIFMSELDYDVNLDFGDFENFVKILPGNIKTSYRFRDNRVKHAKNQAICTTYGPKTEQFCTREAKVKFKNYVNVLPLDFEKNFIIFSDRSDYVLFNNFEDEENPTSTLVKSKAVANLQRKQFNVFSQNFGNL